MSTTELPSVDYGFTADDKGLFLDNDNVQNKVDVKIILEVENTPDIPLEPGSTAYSLSGLLKTIKIEGQPYVFLSKAFVKPGGDVTIGREKDLLTAFFTNTGDRPERVTLVPKGDPRVVNRPGLFLTRSNLHSGFNTIIVVTVAEVGPGREFTIEAGEALESVTGVFEVLKFVVGVQSWVFGSSYDVEQDSGVLVKYNEDEVPTAYFTDVQGAKQAVALIPLLVEPGPDA